MKRLLCVVLVVCLVLPWGGVLAGEEYVPVEILLWGIPFGVSGEECVALARELAGIELDVRELKWGALSLSSPHGKLRLLENRAELYAEFDEDEKVHALWVDIPFGGIGADEVALEFTLEMLEEARERFGETLGGWLSLRDTYASYSLPLADGMPDTNILYSLYMETPESLSMYLFCDGGEVTFHVNRDDSYITGLFVGISFHSPERMSHELNRLSELREYSESVDEDAKR